MTTLESVRDLAGTQSLEVLGALHISEDDRDLVGTGTLILLGPKEPGFWPLVQCSPEFEDGAPDPLDRWSKRVVTEIAQKLDGRAFFPFSEGPFLPFYRWAIETGSLWPSPVRLLVHESQGLLVSIRGAIAVPKKLVLDPPATQPCLNCATQPCRRSCPVGALTPENYLVDTCHAFLNTQAGKRCLDGGCNVRVSCPASKAYGRLPEQSAYHMRQFHK